MGRETSKTIINPIFILKITVPFVFPLVGFLVSSFLSDDSDTASEMDSFHDSIKEECEEGMSLSPCNASNDLKFQNISGEVVTMRGIRMDPIEKPNLEGEFENLKSMMYAIEEMQNQMNLQFNEYNHMRRHESFVEKLQIMCLGLKFEDLEKQIQSLEEGFVMLMAEKEDYDAIRVEFNRFKGKIKKISRENSYNSGVVRRRIKIFEAKEAELIRRNEDLQMAIREIGNMTKLKENTFENEDLIIEQACMTSITNNEETHDRIQAKWTDDIQEKIYLGWITACLKNELSVSNEIMRENSLKEQKPENETLFISFSPQQILENSNEARDCTAKILYGANGECSNSNLNMRKDKLIHRIKGWTKVKGKCKRLMI